MSFFKTVFSKGTLQYWLIAVIVLFVMCFTLLYFSEAQVPSTLTSSGIVAIISAIIGVMLTALAVALQLRQQSENESQKDKAVKIFEQKIRIYSKFTEKVWEIIGEDKITDEELKGLRKICFQKLVFYIDDEQATKIAEQIDVLGKRQKKAASKITHILQKSLNSDNFGKAEKPENLEKLFDSFGKFSEEETPAKTKLIQGEESASIIPIEQNSRQEQQHSEDRITYWHFNILSEKEQMEAFKNKNWVLALIEYGEEWRTNLIKQVKPNDVVFLFKRGGAGYIGAFRAKEFKVLDVEKKDTYSAEEKESFDIYKGIEDGASLASNILVEPIAFNFKGVGAYTVKRRTIERMNDPEAIKYLLTRFNGDVLDSSRLEGKGTFDNGERVCVNEDYFTKILRQNNLA